MIFLICIIALLTPISREEAMEKMLTDVLFIMSLEDRIEALDEEVYDLEYHLRELRRYGLTDFLRYHIAEVNRQILGLNRQIRTHELHKLQHINGLRRNLYSSAIAVNESAANLALLYAERLIMSESLRLATIRYEFGLISQTILRNTAHSLTLLERRIYEAEILHANNVQSLNLLLGLPLHYETRVCFGYVEFLGFECMEVAVSETPSVELLQIALDIERDILSLHIENWDRRWRYSSPTTEQREEEDEVRAPLIEAVNRAEIELNRARASAEASLYAFINNLASIDSGIATQEYEVLQAYLALETAEINFGLGRITRFTLQEATFALQRAEHTLAGLNRRRLQAILPYGTTTELAEGEQLV